MLNKLVNSLNKTLNQNQFSNNTDYSNPKSFTFDQWLPTIEIFNFFDKKIIDNLPVHGNYGISFNKIRNHNLNFFFDSLNKLNFFYRNLIYIKFSNCEFSQNSLNIFSDNLHVLNNSLIIDISDIRSYELVEYFLTSLQKTGKRFLLKKSDEIKNSPNNHINSQMLTITVNNNLFDQLNAKLDLDDYFSSQSIRGKIGIDLFLTKNNPANSSLAITSPINAQLADNYQKQEFNNPLTFEKVVNCESDSIEFYQPLLNSFLQSSALENFDLANDRKKNSAESSQKNLSSQPSSPTPTSNIDDPQNIVFASVKNNDNFASKISSSLDNFAYQLSWQFFSKTPPYRLELINNQINY